MIQKQIQVGRDTFTVSGDSLLDVLKAASDLEVIAKRVSRDSTLLHRESGGHHFFEAVRFVKGKNGSRKAVKQLGNSDGTLFLAANEPWRVYDPDLPEGVEYVQFDYLTDDAREWGFDDSALAPNWVKAKAGKKGKLRVYKPVA